MNNKNKKIKSFTKEVFDASNAPDIFSGLVMFLYSVFVVNISIKRHWVFIVTVICLIFLAQFGFASITNKIICSKVNKKISKWRKEGLSKEERTQLFLMLHKIPVIKQTESAVYFFTSSILLAVAYYIFLQIHLAVNLCSLVATFLGSYIASILSLSFSRKICTKYECMLVGEGLDEEIHNSKKIYGISYNTCFTFYCIIPVVWSCILFAIMFIVYFYNNVPSSFGYLPAKFPRIVSNQLPKFALILGLSFIVCAVSVYSFLSSILVSAKQLQDAMNLILQNDIFTVKLSTTDYENEFTYNIGLVNDVVFLFRSVFEDIQAIGTTMKSPVERLTEISQTTASTSLEQSSGVKEILATMEETDSQTKEILNKISNVTVIAEETSAMVDAGSEKLQQNLSKMDEITEGNLTTINGIRDLSEKIGSIWEIVKIINSIADQTRIIAFNAELEASSAGESGKNFHIVANEVRRLAAGITSSVEKIKDRITEIQHSSDNLIITSESGTEKIRDGQRLFEKLDERFGEIRKSSDITVESAKQIREFIFQQSAAFDQIVSTVRQISSGIENFSAATNTVNETAIKLRGAAEKLNNLHNQIIEKM